MIEAALFFIVSGAKIMFVILCVAIGFAAMIWAAAIVAVPFVALFIYVDAKFKERQGER